MKKFLKIIFILFYLILFPFLVQADCTNPVSPSNGATNIDFLQPITLDWCSDADANSYYVRIYDAGEISLEDGTTTDSKIIIPEWYGIFTGDTTYEWEFTACTNNDFTGCNDYTEKWSFSTKDIELTPPELVSPLYDPSEPNEVVLVNSDDSLEWRRTETQDWWARSFVYEIEEGENVIFGPIPTESNSVSFDSIWDSLARNNQYSWHVKSCYSWDDTNCDNYGESWYFKTAGALPTNLIADNTIIPVKLDWDNVEKSLSYVYKVSLNDQIVATDSVEKSEIYIDYPELVQDETYSWGVKSCVDSQGNYCGAWEDGPEFTTFKLDMPCFPEGLLNEDCPSPEDNGTLFTYQKTISWGSVEGAKAYRYHVDHSSISSEETDENCKDKEGQVLVPDTITTSRSARIPLKCLGEYKWYLQSCLDAECNETSDSNSPTLTFSFIQPTPPAQFGLVPCGRVSNNPDTLLWNERDPCEIKHVFLLLKNIIDLVLWRIGLIALALLIIFTAVVSYFSLGAPDTVVNVKQIWQKAGTGYLIMFLAWWIINALVKIVGFTDTWWSIPF